MADINSQAPGASSAAAGATAREPGGRGRSASAAGAQIALAEGADGEFLQFAELLFFAYRDFTSEADQVLLEYGFGRAHHRVLHFVARAPGQRVADLLDILKITKQSLARVLKQLIDEGFVEQKAGHLDRRERLLFPTPKGAALADRLLDLQTRRIAAALETAGGGAAGAIRQFLLGMISREDRDAVEMLLSRGATRSTEQPDAMKGK